VGGGGGVVVVLVLGVDFFFWGGGVRLGSFLVFFCFLGVGDRRNSTKKRATQQKTTQIQRALIKPPNNPHNGFFEGEGEKWNKKKETYQKPTSGSK